MAAIEKAPLRERKRAAQEALIERAAVELSKKHGFHNVSVEMICEASMVSPRTFYNYFGSKENVVLGNATPLAAEADIQRFVHEPGPDVLSDFLVMVVESLTENAPDRELYIARQEVLYNTPELAAKKMAIDGELEARYVEIIVDRLRRTGRTADDAGALEDEARMIIAIIRGVLTYTAQKWIQPDYNEPVPVLLDDAIGLLRRIVAEG